MSDFPNIDHLTKQSYQILSSLTVSIYGSFHDNFNKKPDEEIINWVRNSQKIINEYIRELLRFNEEEMIEGINSQSFIKIQDEIILERLKTMPKKELPITNLLYQKLIEAFSLHNQFLLDEWLFR